MTPNIRPTRRGYAVLAVGAAAFVAGAVFGPRALDAVVLPVGVALLAAVVQVWRTPAPTVERRLPPADEPGASGVVEVTLDAPEPYPATLRDRLPAGVQSDSIPGGDATTGDRDVAIEATVGGETVSYEITPRHRGKHEIGPASVVAVDVLGLVERTHAVDTRDAVIAFPRVRALSSAVRADLRTTSQSRSAAGRDEFDNLREYVRGDALRDVHWKSSAKRDNLMVQEFTADADPERVTVAAGTTSADGGADAGGTALEGTKTSEGAAEAIEGEAKTNERRGETSQRRAETSERAADATNRTSADAMAEAAASVCLSLVRDGVNVTLATPTGTVDAAPGRTRDLLDHLAVATGGAVPNRSVDVEIVAGAESTSIRFDGRRHDFETLVDGVGDGAATESAAATTASQWGNREKAGERAAREAQR
ncbi:DUF58 domain-containing protein [Halobellus litoreus]|uniref:DUF58 domain-containing protein n=1 Tax=Halobellus litoreus TaxID=755310 RepID=A0ABD6DV82_9EURY|nr:DUF58 domain-containing protein [Halobellus litoreus]